MKTGFKRAMGWMLTVCLLVSLAATALAAEPVDGAVAQSAQYILKTVPSPQVASIGGEWAVLGLARSGYGVPQAYWDGYYEAVQAYVKDCGGVLHDKKYTEYSRVVLALTAIGADPTDVAGYNLLAPLGDFEKTIWQGINGPIWALLALDSGGYTMPVNPQAKTQATRQLYVEELLSRQLKNGGWSLAGEGGDDISADPDVTGMALQALAKYQTQEAVKAATQKALECLSQMQDADGGYSSWGATNSESVVQVLVALCELGLDLEDSRFVKNGHTLLENLLSYRQDSGGFVHTTVGAGSNLMASEQGLYGLAAVQRAQQERPSLYRMSDVCLRPTEAKPTGAGLPGKHQDVKKTAITAPGAAFEDTAGHENQAAIEALAARGIINGTGAGAFAPERTMTRAEFATIVVKALGLPVRQDAASGFTDVASGAWYTPYVMTASSYGITGGVGGGRFNPSGVITRQEAAVMLARAGKLCGMDTDMNATAVRDMLAQFGDYTTIAPWAQQAMAFCYREDLLDQSDLHVEPGRTVRRCEIAQMLYNLLQTAKLL